MRRVPKLATSVRLEQGHRIRVAIAGADADNFERYPRQGTPTIAVHREAEATSAIDLPVVGQ
jgi:uncharacterized protein